MDRSDLTYIWGGIQYLAVEMVDFLRVQAIINRIKADKENIRDIWLLIFKKRSFSIISFGPSVRNGYIFALIKTWIFLSI